MALINPAEQFPVSELEKELQSLSLADLVELFCNELITYRTSLAEIKDGGEINRRAKKDYENYEERVGLVKKELVRRENLYLLYHQSYFSG